ncbi:MFS transporter [Motilimonas cestriensis]|uniref:MFS transporter n=1 Tax=Motilimonas cestriensis TaxID=2742685 RepID=A0ABS8WD85_9GAMM|nr:MFS transporter [Motilimonas cestriensis]MCE2596999.1 MFS transporter [Motilimonas cestriensis]
MELQNSKAKKYVLRLALLINMLSIATLMMVMPLAADFVTHLDMKAEHIGYISGGATLASALVGFFIAPYLDRFDRKHALIGFLVVRSVFIVLCGLSTTQSELLTLFILAGCFAGPVSGLMMASVIDVADIKERGKAVAFVASGFSLAAIIMVPLSLELSARVSWQVNFYFFGVLGLVLAGFCWHFMPNLRAHLKPNNQPTASHANMLFSPAVIIACSAVAISMFGHFLLVPNLSSFFQFNLNFPREHISLLYLFGGVASLVAMRFFGRTIDKGWIMSTLWISSLFVAATVYLGFISLGSLSVYIIFILFMAFSSARTAAISAITSRVPAPHQRAAFMSYQGTVSSLAAGAASMASSVLLTSNTHGELIGIQSLASLTILTTFCAPIAIFLLLRSLRARHEASVA